MLTYIEGDLFNSKCEYVICTVNCIGVMGKGIALEFKKRYPEMYLAYREACDKGEVKIGKMWVWNNIINFPTKDDWRNPSKLEYIKAGLLDLKVVVRERGIKSLGMPKLGCSNGKLTWEDVKKLIEIFHSVVPELDLQVYLK